MNEITVDILCGHIQHVVPDLGSDEQLAIASHMLEKFTIESRFKPVSGERNEAAQQTENEICYFEGHVEGHLDEFPWCPRCGALAIDPELVDGKKWLERGDSVYASMLFRPRIVKSIEPARKKKRSFWK